MPRSLLALLIWLSSAAAPAQEPPVAPPVADGEPPAPAARGCLVLSTEPADCIVRGLYTEDFAKKSTLAVADWLIEGEHTLTFERDGKTLATSVTMKADSVVYLQVNFAKDRVVKVKPEALGFPEDYAGRFSANRLAAAKRAGGSKKTEEAVALGLGWLAAHQKANGSWGVSDYPQECARAGRPGDAAHPPCTGVGDHDWAVPGLTALSLLAFLGAGSSSCMGEYRDVVKSGITYLIRVQDNDGCFGARDGHYMYNHAIATLAMCENAACSFDHLGSRASAQQGLDFLAAAQAPGRAWRYVYRADESDTSVTTWCVLALLAGRVAGLRISEEALAVGLKWIDDMTHRTEGTIGYLTRGDPGSRLRTVKDLWDTNEAMTAAGLAARLLAGGTVPPELTKSVDLLLASRPTITPADKVDMYYWYYGSLAMFQVGGNSWEAWNERGTAVLLHRQVREGGVAGSWPPEDPWGTAAGRVYSTALGTLTLETYYRHPRPKR